MKKNMHPRRAFWLAGVAITVLTLLSLTLGGPRADSSLLRVAVPDDGICPDVIYQSGILHMVYGQKNGDIYYTQSGDEGKTFSKPARINSRTSAAVVGHERGPKIALGRDAAVQVAWQGSDNHSVFVARSTDGGKLFSAPRNLAPQNQGLDGVSIAADGAGQVYVVWHMGSAGPESPGSSLLQVAYSKDNGGTFAAAKQILSNYPGGACECCMTKVAAEPGGKFLVAFRGGYHNIRDIYVLRGTVSDPRLEASLVSNDQWEFPACPMQGPSVDISPEGGQVAVAWTSREQVFHTVSGDGGKSFRPRAAPIQRGREIRRDPFVLMNQKGENFFLWVEGRSIFWERTAANGNLLDSGREGPLPSNSKPVAFLRANGDFALVY